MNTEASLTSWVDCGWFRISKIRSAIERYCFINKLHCELYETRELFGSGRIDFRISGTTAQILQLKQDYVAWGKQLEALIE